MNAAPKIVPSTSTSMQNLLETAAAKGYNTFGKAVEAAGLSETLAGPGPFTVFAPTDAAFASLPEGKLDMLLKPENKPELISVLNYHVVSGRNSAAQVGKWNAARTIQGQSAPIKLIGTQVSIGDARLTAVDIDAKNGFLHGIDKVNLPSAPVTKQ